MLYSLNLIEMLRINFPRKGKTNDVLINLQKKKKKKKKKVSFEIKGLVRRIECSKKNKQTAKQPSTENYHPTGMNV